ncbi:MAG: NCS2 family permease [Actinomycetota bacterium]|nr:NCS2 family permease [Actinomycetota bacterium]
MAAATPLDRRFRLSERGTSLRTEVMGGLATFLTMSYIVFVNPAILSAAGLPFAPVAIATAVAAAIFTALMGLVANLPFALASGLGLNAVVAFDLILGRGLAPRVGMACIVLEGAVAVVLVLAGLREAILRAVPLSLKLAIGVGIGLFIALVGLREGGIVVNDPATGIGLADLSGGPPLIALAGILVAGMLAARRARGSILAGIATATLLGLVFGVLDAPSGVAQLPGSHSLDTVGDALAPSALGDALSVALIPVIFTLFMTDFFDTVGTAVAVASAGGLTDERGELPNTRRVLLVDSVAAMGGGALGVSSVTTYVESGAGVSEGARTGLASLVTAGLFALTVLFVPLIELVGQGVKVGQATIHPAVAPALVMVGYLMIRLVAGIDWTEPSSSLPAFLVLAGIPLTFSIAAGIGLGIIGYVAAKLAQGRARDVHPLMWALVPLFAAFYASDWLSANVF